MAEANCRASAGSSAAIVCHVDLVANVMGTAEVAGAVSNTDGMLLVFFAHFVYADFAEFSRACNLFEASRLVPRPYTAPSDHARLKSSDLGGSDGPRKPAG
jgi:hypothetical protein